MKKISNDIQWLINWRKSRRTVAQMGNLFDPVERISKIIVVIMHAIFGLQSKKPAKEFFTSVKDIPRQFDGCEAYVKFILEMAQDVFNDIRSQLGFNMVQFMSLQNDKVDEWMLEVRNIMDSFMKSELKVTHENADRVYSLVNRGNALFS